MNTQTISGFKNFSAFAAILFILAALLLFGASTGAGETTIATGGPAILSASEIDYPPFCIVDSDGRANGFSVELMRAALKAMGREVTFRTGPWKDVRGWLEQGEVQALPLVGRTPEREPVFDFTVPYMTLHGAIVIRKGTPDIRNLDDLKGRHVAVMQGDNAEEFLRRVDRGIEIHTTATFDAALQELSEGRHDAVVIQRLVALRLIKEAQLANLQIVNRPIEGFRQDFCFAVKEGDRDTLALLNEGLAVVMADGTYQHLHAKWFAALELPANRRIIVGGDHNYPPYEYLDKQGRPAGYNVDLTRAIAKAMGLDIEIRLGPWSKIRKGLERGEIDAIQGILYSPERDLMFDFTPPHTVNQYISVVRKGEGPPPTKVEGLAGKRIVVQKGDIMHDFALKNGLGAQVSPVDAQEDALRELARGRYDCALVSRLTALYWIEKHGWENLMVGQSPLLSPEYCYAVAKNKPLLTQFTEGLKVIEKNGEYRRIRKKWMGIYGEDSPDFKDILRYVAKVTLPLFLLLSVFFLWSWSLRKQVANRTAALRKSEEKFRGIFENVQDVYFEVTYDGTILDVSPSIEILSKGQYRRKDVIGKSLFGFYANPGERELVLDVLQQQGSVTDYEITLKNRDGSNLPCSISSKIQYDVNGHPINIIGSLRDITERKKAEEERENLQEQLNQAQKIESMGRLAGGVAHDYNNMLSVILGYTELAMEKVPSDDPLYADLKEVLKAANRSTEITRQLLTFARKQTISPKILDLNETIERMLKMLRRLIGEDIDLAWLPGTGLGLIKMDPSQVDQILANLCVNARDAIADVGKIIIETGSVTFDESYCSKHPGFVSGDFVMLAVSDDGCGMDRETQDKIFEPFFTTKGVGQGTGLGMATVYGIVKQNEGFINVYSEPGKGTTFKIYLPQTAGEAGKTEAKKAAAIPKGSGETVLLVEDESMIMKMSKMMLEQLGYQVLAASMPDEAMNLAEKHAGGIDLLITDVIMPEMNGRELARRINALYPEIKILFMSGYTADIIAHHGVLEDGVNFIQKPFSMRDLGVKIRAVLEEEKQF
ncbi:MAG: response regulator [Desulfobacteraceae bacterium]|nr:MAG: response regulator [Desulfobacteraceae bacterium]